MKLHRKILAGITAFTIFTGVSFGAAPKKSEPKKTEIKVVKLYDNKIPENIKTDIKYKGDDLPELLDYVFIKTKYGNVRKFQLFISCLSITNFKCLKKEARKDQQNLSGIKCRLQMV